MNIPNALTISRLVAIPPLMVLLVARFPGHDQLAAALFIVFSLTDILDGEIARRRETVSDFGKFLDPLADKLFVLSVLIVLVQEGLVAAWVVVVIFSRELMITILRSVAATQGRVISAAPLGKTKTVMQMSAVTLLILQRPYPIAAPLADLRGDVLHERASLTLQRENLAHEPGPCRCITAHMTFKHGRLVFGIRSTRSGRVDRS